MKIKVYFKNYNEAERCHVANVEIGDVVGDPDKALEFAYRWTNNINGSWSLKESKYFEFRGVRYDNTDLNDAVEVVEPVPQIDGRTYGHRSAMMGDEFELGGKTYVVATFGFDEKV